MKRVAVIAALLAGVLAAVGVAAGARQASPTKLTVWVGWSARELSVFKKVTAEYDKAHPDVPSSFNSYNVGIYCGTGGWIDLASYMQKSHISVSQFPPATQYYTQYGGERCALPLLA